MSFHDLFLVILGPFPEDRLQPGGRLRGRFRGSRRLRKIARAATVTFPGRGGDSRWEIEPILLKILNISLLLFNYIYRCVWLHENSFTYKTTHIYMSNNMYIYIYISIYIFAHIFIYICIYVVFYCNVLWLNVTYCCVVLCYVMLCFVMLCYVVSTICDSCHVR